MLVDTSVVVAAFASWHAQHDFLRARLPDPYVGFDANNYGALMPRLVELGISGGAAYDALVAATAQAAGDILIS